MQENLWKYEVENNPIYYIDNKQIVKRWSKLSLDIYKVCKVVKLLASLLEGTHNGSSLISNSNNTSDQN